MEHTTLQATKRQETGSRAARRLRREGLVPAVLYGHGRDTVHLSVPLKEFDHLRHGGARLLDLEIGGTVEPAVVKDLQYDSLGDAVLHVDFARVAMDETITVTVPVELHGLAKGVTSGGILDHVIVDIEVSCLPGNIPGNIRIEIADLDIGDVVHIRDIDAPEGVEFLQDPDAPVVTIHPPVAAAEEEAVEEVELEAEAEPEVIGGRREQEGEQGAQAKEE